MRGPVGEGRGDDFVSVEKKVYWLEKFASCFEPKPGAGVDSKVNTV